MTNNPSKYFFGLKNFKMSRKVTSNPSIRRHQIFLGGSSDENEKVLGKFLARSGAQKKGVPFVVEAIKTVNFSNFFPKTVKFLKKGTPKIFRLRRAFFQKSPRSILRKSSVKEGGGKNILHPPYDGVCHKVSHFCILEQQFLCGSGLKI